MEIELESDADYPLKGILTVKMGKLYKLLNNTVGISYQLKKKFAAVQASHTKRAELLEEIGNKLLYLSKNVLEIEGKLEVIANTILENGQLLVRQGNFKEEIKKNFHGQGEILTKSAGHLESIGESFEEIGRTYSNLGEILTENGEQKFGNLGALLRDYAIK